MIKDIWHSALEIPVFDDTVVFVDDLNNWHTGYTQRDNDGITDHDSGEIYTKENLLRWAYIKDLLALETALDRTRKALDKGMEHITGLNNMIESWLNLINSDLDQETKLRILKSAISAYVENKGGDNE